MKIEPLWIVVAVCLFVKKAKNFQLNEQDLIKMLAPEKPVSILPDKDVSYFIAFPSMYERRVRRSAESENNSSSKMVLVSAPSLSMNFSLDLTPVTNILAPEFQLIETYKDKSTILPLNDQDMQQCLYRSNSAAVSLCDGQMTGIVHHNQEEAYLIRPLPKQFQNDSSNPHLLIRKQFRNSNSEKELINGTNCLHVNDSADFTNYSLERGRNVETIHELEDRPSTRNAGQPICDGKYCRNQFTNLHRKKREVGQGRASPVFVETAVFVDKDLFSHMKNYFPINTERELIRFVLAMINAVQLLYHDPSLGRAVNFILKRLEILKEEPVNLTRPADIDRFLSSFCNWQRTKNPGGDREPQHWDHALMLTGLDLYVKTKHGKVSSQVVGLAPVAGMCTPTSSCTVNEGRHFESVYVVAHEIGHNLGMRHDGPLADNDCDPSSYIMSPTLGSGKITWSPCSKKYLQSFLETTQSKCLLDHGNSAGQLDHEAEGSLPGERFDANQQCKLKYGKESKHSPQQLLEDICRDLHCEKEKYTWTSHPALEGTKCGLNMWCRGGKCVSKKLSQIKTAYATSLGALAVERIDGNWSNWRSQGECDSGCLFGEEGRLRSGSTGIMESIRKCDNPRPQGGGKDCQGINKRYQACIAKQCLNVPRLTVKEFADQICTRAKDVDHELTGYGFQKSSYDAQESCSVWCQRRNGQVKARGWSFPDGTVCNMKLTNKTDRSSYCINGRCEEFVCDLSDETKFLEHSDFCLKEKESQKLQKTSQKQPRDIPKSWTIASSCHYNCILPGKGIRLVFNKHKSHQYMIQLCQPNRQTCTRIRSPVQYASMICRQYKDKVQGLSGFGMQIFPTDDQDEDRPCKVACQDDKISHRFYLVNGKGGWFPFGTDCSGKKYKRQAYCISGKCLEFTTDGVPKTNFTTSLFPRLMRRRRRSTTVDLK